MKHKLLFSTLLLGALAAPAQTFQWAHGIGSTGIEEGLAVATDATGNVYNTGGFMGTVDFDPSSGVANLSNTTGIDIFVSKYDANGNYLWAKQIGGSNLDSKPRAIAVDATGNVYITGFFIGTVDFDPSAASFNMTATNQDIFVCKLDASGNFVWAKAMSGVSSEAGQALTLDATGNIYLTGYFNSTVDFDPNAGVANLSNSTGADIFVAKYDNNGNYIWAKQLGGSSSNSYGYAIAVDVSGNVYSAGSFQGTVDFDPNAGTSALTPAGLQDAYISKLDANGNYVWAKQIGGSLSDEILGMDLDASGNIHVTGFFEGACDFDPSASVANLTNSAGLDIFVAKYDVNGNYTWAKQIGGSSFDARGKSVDVDASGNVYSTGFFAGSVDFDPSTSSFTMTAAGPSGNNNAYVSKLDMNGNFVWAANLGGTGGDIGNCVTVDASGNIITTGNFSGTADFDPYPAIYNLTSAGSTDLFLVKLHPAITLNIQEAAAGFEALVYPNPATSEITIRTAENLESVLVYNLLGELVQQEGTNTFSVEQLPAGIYTLQIKTVKGIGTTRFVKH